MEFQRSQVNGMTFFEYNVFFIEPYHSLSKTFAINFNKIFVPNHKNPGVTTNKINKIVPLTNEPWLTNEKIHSTPKTEAE